jgi:hypothetical protein
MTPTETQRVGSTPRRVPSQPPSSPPIGIDPQTMNRTEAFMRPSSGGGHTRWRKLTWATL